MDVERIRNTDLFSQFMEKHPFKQRGSPITFYFSFSFIFWDLKIVNGYGARQSISFTGNDCYMDTKPFKCLIFRIPLSYVLPPNFKYFVMYRKVKKKSRRGGQKKSNVFVRAFLILFLAKTTCQASWVLQCSHFRIYDAGVGDCVQNVSFLSANCLCKYVLANIFWFSLFCYRLKMLMVLL